MRLVLALLAIVMLSMVGLAGVQASLDDTRTQTTITAEEWTVDLDNVTQLNDSNINGADYNETENVTVRNESGTVMTAGTDYEWFESNGTVKALSGGDLTDGETAEIDYGYTLPDEEQLAMSSIVTLLSQVGGYAALLIPVLILLFVLGGR